MNQDNLPIVKVNRKQLKTLEIDLYLLDTNESGPPDVRLDFVTESNGDKYARFYYDPDENGEYDYNTEKFRDFMNYLFEKTDHYYWPPRSKRIRTRKHASFV